MFDNLNFILTFGLVFIALFWLITDPRSRKERILYLFKPKVLFQQSIILVIILLHLYCLQFISFNFGMLNQLVVISGVFLFLLGFAVTIFSKINMGKNWGVPAQFDGQRQDLVTGGLYRFSRNPMYIGFLLVAFGYFIALRSLLILVAVALFLILNNVAKEEEKLLEKRFGKKYSVYKSSVPRFL